MEIRKLILIPLCVAFSAAPQGLLFGQENTGAAETQRSPTATSVSVAEQQRSHTMVTRWLKSLHYRVETATQNLALRTWHLEPEAWQAELDAYMDEHQDRPVYVALLDAQGEPVIASGEAHPLKLLRAEGRKLRMLTLQQENGWHIEARRSNRGEMLLHLLTPYHPVPLPADPKQLVFFHSILKPRVLEQANVAAELRVDERLALVTSDGYLIAGAYGGSEDQGPMAGLRGVLPPAVLEKASGSQQLVTFKDSKEDGLVRRKLNWRRLPLGPDNYWVVIYYRDEEIPVDSPPAMRGTWVPEEEAGKDLRIRFDHTGSYWAAHIRGVSPEIIALGRILDGKLSASKMLPAINPLQACPVFHMQGEILPSRQVLYLEFYMEQGERVSFHSYKCRRVDADAAAEPAPPSDRPVIPLRIKVR